jgi:cytochrome P450
MCLLKKIFAFLNRDKISKFESYPGPTPKFPLGNLDLLLGQNPWEATSGLAHNYGNIYVLWFGSTPQLVVNSPVFFRQILNDKWLDYHKDSPLKELTPVITKYTPFLANQPQWKNMRANNPFSAPWFDDWLKKQPEVISSGMELMTSELAVKSKAQNIDLTQNLQRVSFDSFSLSVAGKYLPDYVYKLFVSLGKTGSKRLVNPFILSFVLNPFFYLKRKFWLGYFEKLITSAENAPNPLADDLIQWTSKKGATISDASLIANTANVFYGGVYSVTSNFATVVWLLSQPENKVFEEKVKKEVKSILKNKKTFSYSDLEKMEFLEKVIREAMRLLPPVPFYSRNSSETQVVFLKDEAKSKEYKIPMNTPIILSNYFLHRTEEHWKNALEFNPERWTNEVIKNNPYGGDYFFPFGRGPRSCMGMPYALTFLKTAIASFYAKARFEPSNKGKYEQAFFFGVMMPSGLKGKVVLDPK